MSKKTKTIIDETSYPILKNKDHKHICDLCLKNSELQSRKLELKYKVLDILKEMGYKYDYFRYMYENNTLLYSMKKNKILMAYIKCHNELLKHHASIMKYCDKVELVNKDKYMKDHPNYMLFKDVYTLMSQMYKFGPYHWEMSIKVPWCIDSYLYGYNLLIRSKDNIAYFRNHDNKTWVYRYKPAGPLIQAYVYDVPLSDD